jgi:1-acyl-sn-glycerol-3-phosphate acyltransferase
MIDINYLENIKLVSVPRGQVFVARFILFPNYHIFANVNIQIQGLEKIPKNKTVIFAMNHTDRFNYWPFQYELWRMKDYPFTTVWVKGKYYRNALLAAVLSHCNLIPVPSMRYFIQEFFSQKFGRKIKTDEYRVLKDVVDGTEGSAEALTEKSWEIDALIQDRFVEFIKSYYAAILDKVADLSKRALFEKNLNLIIFPEGTRSTKLGEGKTGLAQLALNTGATIIPVGCNNSDAVYASEKLPFAKSGTVVYRVGDPFSVDDVLKPYGIGEKFKLFSVESKTKYKDNFKAVTNIVMQRISELVDERYTN